MKTASTFVQASTWEPDSHFIAPQAREMLRAYKVALFMSHHHCVDPAIAASPRGGRRPPPEIEYFSGE